MAPLCGREGRRSFEKAIARFDPLIRDENEFAQSWWYLRPRTRSHHLPEEHRAPIASGRHSLNKKTRWVPRDAGLSDRESGVA